MTRERKYMRRRRRGGSPWGVLYLPLQKNVYNVFFQV